MTVGVCVAFCVDRILLVGWRTRKIGEPGIINRVCRGQANADMVAGVGVQDLDVFICRARLANALIGLADRELG